MGGMCFRPIEREFETRVEMEKFTVMELAEQLNVPRTTINDWLSRYADYIDFKMMGKRKVYTASTLAVLREVSELRSTELSSFEIEAELAKRHAVTGEVADESAKDGSAAAVNTEFALEIKRQGEEVAQLIGDRLGNLNSRLESMELNGAAAEARASRWLTVTISLFLLTAGLAVLSVWWFTRLWDENAVILAAKAAAEKDLNLKNNALTASRDELSDWRKRHDSLNAIIDGLREKAKEREVEFADSFRAFREKERAANAEAVKTIRDELAAEKLCLLKELESARGDRDKLAALLGEMRAANERQTKALADLSRETAKAVAAANKVAEKVTVGTGPVAAAVSETTATEVPAEK